MKLEEKPRFYHLHELKALYPEQMTFEHFSSLRSLFEKGDPSQQPELYELLQGLLDEYFFISEMERTQMLLMLVGLQRIGRLSCNGLKFDEIVRNLDLVESPDLELLQELLHSPCRPRIASLVA